MMIQTNSNNCNSSDNPVILAPYSRMKKIYSEKLADMYSLLGFDLRTINSVP